MFALRFGRGLLSARPIGPITKSDRAPKQVATATPSRSKSSMVAAVGVAMTSLLLAVAVLRVPERGLRTPFRYDGDALAVFTWTKSMLEEGWWMTSERLGAPGRLEMHDYPTNPNLHFAALKLLSWFGLRDPFLLVNIYFLLTFPLCAMSAFFVCRSLGLRPLPSMACGLWFAFLPYHFFRGESHLFLAAYQMIPLTTLVAIWLVRGDLLSDSDSRRKTIASATICFASGFDFPYYPVFACLFLMAGGIFGSVNGGSWKPLRRSALLIAVTGFAFVLNMSPNLLYRIEHGGNPSPYLESKRDWIENERYGLKISGMLLPAKGHLIRTLDRMRSEYDLRTIAEPGVSAMMALGVVGSLGLLALLAHGLFSRRIDDDPLVSALAMLAMVAIFIGTLGGLGFLLGGLMGGSFRGYERLSIFVGFFALLAVARWVDCYFARLDRPLLARLAVTMIAAVGLIDMIGTTTLGSPAVARSEFLREADHFRTVEASLPDGAMVFQLPNRPFLSGREKPYSLGDPYTQLRGFLQTSRLRWSYGAVVGREWAEIHQQVAQLPTPRFLTALVGLGFKGLHVDRLGLNEDAEKRLSEFASLLGPATAVSQDGRYHFFTLEEWRGHDYPVLMTFTNCIDEEHDQRGPYRWFRGPAKWKLLNLGSKSRTVRVIFQYRGADDGVTELRVRLDPSMEPMIVAAEPGTPISFALDCPPGETVVGLESTSKLHHRWSGKVQFELAGYRVETDESP